jgi:hypothetical protein
MSNASRFPPVVPTINARYMRLAAFNSRMAYADAARAVRAKSKTTSRKISSDVK